MVNIGLWVLNSQYGQCVIYVIYVIYGNVALFLWWLILGAVVGGECPFYS